MLPKFSNTSSTVKLVCLQNIRRGEVEELVTNKILDQYKNTEKSYQYKIQHSYIDMRYHILNKKLIKY